MTTTLALLSQAADDLMQQYHAIDEDDREARDQILAQLLDNYLQTAEKVDGIAWVLSVELPNEVEKLDKLIKLLDQRKKRMERDVQSLKDYVLFLNGSGLIPDVVMGQERVLKVQRNSQPSVEVETDPATWDSEFSNLYQTRVEYKPDKKAIAELDEANLPIPPGCTVKRGYHVRVEWVKGKKK